MKDSKEIKNGITEISERMRTENELQEKVHKQFSQTEEEHQLLLGEMENQIIEVKKLMEEIKQEETERFENYWIKIPERDIVQEKQQEIIMSELSIIKTTLNLTKNKLMNELELFESKENTSLEEIKWTIKNIQIYNQKEVYNSLLKIREEAK
jgi:hypothetical protein